MARVRVVRASGGPAGGSADGSAGGFAGEEGTKTKSMFLSALERLEGEMVEDEVVLDYSDEDIAGYM
ncbi:MAG: hypothetical protein ABGY24_16865, partial [bacterium]